MLHKKSPPPQSGDNKITALWDHFIYLNQVKTAV